MQIWKFEIKLDNHSIEMPKGARILSVGVQDHLSESIMIWAMVDPEAPSCRRVFAICRTGHSIFPQAPVWQNKLSFLGTVQQGPLVWHVFDGGEV